MSRRVTGRFLFVDFIGRLQPTASIASARAAAATLREERKQDVPPGALQSEVRVMPLHQRLHGEFRRPLMLLLAIVDPMVALRAE
jgi:hypothetical protein